MATTSFALVRFVQGAPVSGDARRARELTTVPAVSVTPGAAQTPAITVPDNKAPGLCWEIATDTLVKVKFGVKGQVVIATAADYDAMIPVNTVMWFAADAAQIVSVVTVP